MFVFACLCHATFTLFTVTFSSLAELLPFPSCTVLLSAIYFSVPYRPDDPCLPCCAALHQLPRLPCGRLCARSAGAAPSGESTNRALPGVVSSRGAMPTPMAAPVVSRAGRVAPGIRPFGDLLPSPSPTHRDRYERFSRVTLKQGLVQNNFRYYFMKMKIPKKSTFTSN